MCRNKVYPEKASTQTRDFDSYDRLATIDYFQICAIFGHLYNIRLLGFAVFLLLFSMLFSKPNSSHLYFAILAKPKEEPFICETCDLLGKKEQIQIMLSSIVEAFKHLPIQRLVCFSSFHKCIYI
jgi:hypothetical protein